ncbi:hypothetical protein [Sinorhizobium meliloti]|uniref:hypothetical protein n=1 Tax=Rhizobium meliloti TaxID=382 RepID=UPI000FD73E1E|nr:hypothetical protein [Sinorhizobium meliloti]RVH27901.1 hypothetical protein CN211_26600 [Sinorhizobium meliloti]
MHEFERGQYDDVASQLALLELVRFAIGEICHHPDPAIFAQRMKTIEENIIDGLNGRTIFHQAPPETESYIKEVAASQVTKILTSIRHSEERAP